MRESNPDQEHNAVEQRKSTVFTAKRCTECGAIYGHPPTVCRECGCEQFEECELPKVGRIYASTIIRVPGSDHQGQEPFTVGVVIIGEDPPVRVTARIKSNERLSPDESVEFIGSDDGVFWFRPR